MRSRCRIAAALEAERSVSGASRRREVRRGQALHGTPSQQGPQQKVAKLTKQRELSSETGTDRGQVGLGRRQEALQVGRGLVPRQRVPVPYSQFIQSTFRSISFAAGSKRAHTTRATQFRRVVRKSPNASGNENGLVRTCRRRCGPAHSAKNRNKANARELDSRRTRGEGCGGGNGKQRAAERQTEVTVTACGRTSQHRTASSACNRQTTIAANEKGQMPQGKGKQPGAD